MGNAILVRMDDPTSPQPINPETRRRVPGARAVQVVLRSIHIMAMALVLGGLARGGTYEILRTSIFITVLSGILLLAVELARGCMVITQGSGVTALLKLTLLGLGHLFPTLRLQFYLAATFVASIGSHMSGEWRHFSFRRWRVLESDNA